jgi:RimJ/RimL family protein N-acetyltransferase
MGTDEALMSTLGGVWTEIAAKERLQWNCRQWAQFGHGQWMFFKKDDGQLVGRAGIRRMPVNGVEEVELGYSVLPAFWAQGFAPEMGRLAVEIAFDVFKYPSVVAFTLVDNRRSERVMQKLRFELEARIVHAGQPHVLYRRWNPRIMLDDTVANRAGSSA